MALLVLTLGCLGTAWAANDPGTIRARGTLIVSVKNQGDARVAHHRDPAHFEKRALEISIAQAIATRLLGTPDKLEVRMLRKPERLPAVMAGEVDLAISMVRVTPATRALVDFSTPYYQDGLAVLQATGGPIRAPRDLAGHTFAVLARSEGEADETVASLAEVAGTTPAVILVDNFRDGVTALAAGRAVGLVSEAVNIDVFLARHGGAYERSPRLTTASYAVALAKGNPALLAVVNEVLATLRASGELARLERAATLPGGGVDRGTR